MNFSPQKKDELITKLQHYFIRELDIELAQFDADFFLGSIDLSVYSSVALEKDDNRGT